MLYYFCYYKIFKIATPHRLTTPSFRQLGFTIVELLIVIVIISILATLVIFAYTGIQRQAHNNSRIATAKELQKILNAYIAQEGKYPYNNYACMGTGYTDWNGDGSLDCHVNGGTHPSPTLDTEIKRVSAVPKVEASPIKGTATNVFSGYAYHPNIYVIDGQSNRGLLAYWLDGTNLSCGLPVVNTVAGGYAATGTLNSNSVANYANVTACYLPLNAL